MSNTDTLIGLNPGAAFGSSKCWLPEYYARVGDYFAKNPKNKVVVFWGPGEQKIADNIKSLMKNKCFIYTDKIIPLGALKVLVKRCSLLVTNDSGPRQFGLAFSVPTVTVMGPIDPNLTANDCRYETIVKKVPVCGPCRLRVCKYNHQCMKLVKPEYVISAAEKLLNNSRKIKENINETKSAI